jgi:type VI secretion system protein ImpM
MPGRHSRSTGFFGKLPARGDFVGTGLPSAIVRPWDQAISAALAAARAALADRWPEIWRYAPVWCFALPEALCGPAAIIGLWMPSIDRVGRAFPLMIATTCPGATPETMARHGTAWLDAAEDAGRAALAEDLGPDRLAALIPPPPDLAATFDAGLPCGLHPRPGAGLWWTAGGPHVAAQGLALAALPDGAAFLAMLVERSPRRVV